MPLDFDDLADPSTNGEHRILWDYWRHCDTCAKIVSDHKVQGAMRVQEAVNAGATLTDACRSAVTSKRYSAGVLKSAYQDVSAYSFDVWEPILIRSRYLVKRSVNSMTPNAWHFILAALRHENNPTVNSVIQRAVALSFECGWVIPQNKTLLPLIKGYRAELVAKEAASVTQFPHLS